MRKVLGLVGVVVTGAIALVVRSKAKSDEKPWKEVEGIVVDVVYRSASPKAKSLSPYSIVRFTDKHEYGEDIITVEIPQPGDLIGIEATKGFFVGLYYRWDVNTHYQRVLQVSVFMTGNTPMGDRAHLEKLMATV